MTFPDIASIGAALAALLQEGAAAAGPARPSPALQAEAVERGFRFLIGAYTVVWVILALYIMSLSVRLRRISQQVRRLKARLGA